MKLGGNFVINPNGTVTTYVEKAGSRTIDLGLKPGNVVNLDFFYAERSTSESNTKITISDMTWPISADNTLDAKIVGKLEDSNSNLVQYTANIANRDPDSPLELIRLAAYIKETANPGTTIDGFLPLSIKTLQYSKTPNNPDSWQYVDITAPLNSENGFTLATPLEMTPHGTAGDTLYFRYFVETSGPDGQMDSRISFYTELNGSSGITLTTQLPTKRLSPSPTPSRSNTSTKTDPKPLKTILRN